MTKDPVTTTADTLAYEALTAMEDRPSQISVLPVVNDERRFVGMLRLHDVVRAGL
jgi:arabinose-5-phosphate isomerase